MKAHHVLIATLTLTLMATNAFAYIEPVQDPGFEAGLTFWTPTSTGPGTHQVTALPDGIPGSAIDLLNENSGSVNNETAALQLLDVSVIGAPCLYLLGDVKVLRQTNISSLHDPCEFDFPAILSLYYIDDGGSLRSYRHGFYLQSTLGYVADSTKVNPGEWYHFVSPNLMTYLPFTPEHLVRVQVSGIGWDYHSKFDNVKVQICEIPEPSALLCLAAPLAGLLFVRRRTTG